MNGTIGPGRRDYSTRSGAAIGRIANFPADREYQGNFSDLRR
jgi:hypothetical protein